MWDCEVMIRLSYVGKLDVAFPIQKSIQGGKYIGRVKYIFTKKFNHQHINLYKWFGEEFNLDKACFFSGNGLVKL